MSEYAELQAADAYCRLLTRKHYENFLIVSGLPKGRLRIDLMRIYAYCRTTDDYGDESGGAAIARLELWRDQVQALFAGEAPVHPVLVALRETVEHYGLSREPFANLIEANLRDQTTTRYETWESLREYCTFSAAPVGRMVLAAFGIANAHMERLSDDVCIGLQLANFAQDVTWDLAKGRSYLVQAEVRATGVAGAVRAHCERARSLLASGCELERLAPRALRRQLSLYRLGGLAIVRAVERSGYRSDAARPRVPTLAKVALLLGTLAHV
ncbi:MAG TPA: squalene/phytoene synthase family protein [Candidatus Dormibacteraeota bacterium]|nr:squalene/phytoene synthase family protein [Candidatus Dormibacteraeota bacterium]